MAILHLYPGDNLAQRAPAGECELAIVAAALLSEVHCGHRQAHRRIDVTLSDDAVCARWRARARAADHAAWKEACAAVVPGNRADRPAAGVHAEHAACRDVIWSSTSVMRAVLRPARRLTAAETALIGEESSPAHPQRVGPRTPRARFAAGLTGGALTSRATSRPRRTSSPRTCRRAASRRSRPSRPRAGCRSWCSSACRRRAWRRQVKS